MQKNPTEFSSESIDIGIINFFGQENIITAMPADDSEFEREWFGLFQQLDKYYKFFTPCDLGCLCPKSQALRDPEFAVKFINDVNVFSGWVQHFYHNRDYIRRLLSDKEPYGSVVRQKRDNYLAMLHRCSHIVINLCLSSFIEQALTLLKPLVKLLHFIATELKDFKPKQLKPIRLFQLTVEMLFIMMVRDFAYCLMQLGDYEAAGIKSAEAKQVLNQFQKGLDKGNFASFDLFHNSILALYHLQKNNTKLAQEFLDDTSKYVYDKKNHHQRLIMFDHIYACDQLAAALLHEKNYLKAYDYHQQAKEMLGSYLIISSPKQPLIINKSGRYLYRCDSEALLKSYQALQDSTPLYLKLFFLDKAQVLVKQLDKFIHLFTTPYNSVNETKQVVELHCASLDSTKTIFRHLLEHGNKTCRIDAQNNKILITELHDTDLNQVVAALNSATEKQMKEARSSQPKLIKPPTPKTSELASISKTEIDQAIRNSFSLYKPAPPKKKAIKEIETVPTTGDSIVVSQAEPDPLMQLAQQLHIPVDTIFSLGHPPYIPHGYWYAHLNLQLDEQLNKEVRAVLNRGQLTGRGQAIKPAKKEVAQRLGAVTTGEKNYTYKLRLLGPKGKGDIRVYGWVKTIDAQRKLIVLDHIEMDAHKKLSLPDAKINELHKKIAGPSQ